jgi:UDP-arabinose 4-epimerase
MSKTLFVTGGAGYVGSHCCKAFSAAGWNVVVYDNLSRGWRDFVRWGDLIEGDIRDLDNLEAAIQKVKPAAVAHFAALAYVGESVSDPANYYRTNVLGTMNLMDAMRAAGINKLIFSSSCATYGIPDKMPITEATPQNPINPYGRTKLIAEGMLRDYDTAYGIKSVALRYFNAAGADPEVMVGERHEPETHAIPLIIRAAAPDSNQTFMVFGSDYETDDGTCVRDYIHVQDLASAHLKALDYLERNATSAVFNLGQGNGISVRAMIEMVERNSKSVVRHEYAPRRPGDPGILVADASLARDVLGWVPERSSIDKIVSDALRWAEKDATRRGIS